VKCPHCLVAFHDTITPYNLGSDAKAQFWIQLRRCPDCGRYVLHLLRRTFTGAGPTDELRLVYPKGTSRPPCPPEVPADLSEDYTEACTVLADSPKASAALSRRCLQHFLRDYAKVAPSNLAKEIQEIIDSKTLPSHLVEAVDGVRNIGNFATHPMKDKSSGEVLPVEPGEAEWNLDVLEALFDHYFVQPEVIAKKRKELNEKLAKAGKPPMK
jgi:Domain of unknown function (DUF4145)